VGFFVGLFLFLISSSGKLQDFSVHLMTRLLHHLDFRAIFNIKAASAVNKFQSILLLKYLKEVYKYFLWGFFFFFLFLSKIVPSFSHLKQSRGRWLHSWGALPFPRVLPSVAPAACRLSVRAAFNKIYIYIYIYVGAYIYLGRRGDVRTPTRGPPRGWRPAPGGG